MINPGDDGGYAPGMSNSVDTAGNCFPRRVESCRCCTFFRFRTVLPTFFKRNVGKFS